ncbi:amidase signature enzyme [Polychaeton citri CBS 116435]|uniref:Amidase signature enzyme n=1 Tax=Polychaeton citri CBS 116435 TaxID=1314669 RepID=A0A9P4QJY9_9PEZI|nr:amidase signature enzyme [Polychaeton citri CBS 116435]
MSIVSLSSSNPTCTLDDLQNAAKVYNFSIASGSVDESTFLQFANAFDATCQEIQDLPEYEHPGLRPTAVEGGERTFCRPSNRDNPLNGWSHVTSLKSADPKARKEGRLSGRTIAIKDNISVAGLPLRIGCSPSLYASAVHPVSSIDATIVSRILAAGAEIKGTGTCENLSLFALSYTSDSGPVHNAWKSGYCTGGSSSGCGTLVSVPDVQEARVKGRREGGSHDLGEGVDMAMGGDQGGSVRLPAAYSGIYGLKPTHGLVPYTGIASLSPMVDHAGPMARTVEDIALLLSVVAGYDGIDSRMTPLSPKREEVKDYLAELDAWRAIKEAAGEWTPTAAAKGLKVGILEEGFAFAGIDEEVKATVLQAVRRFSNLGADVRSISIPLHAHGPAIWTVACRPGMGAGLSNAPSTHLSHPLPHVDPVPSHANEKYYAALANRNPAVINVLLNAAQMEQKHGARLARKAQMHIHELRAAYDSALEAVDILITPLNPTVAPRIPAGALEDGGKGGSVWDIVEPTVGATMNTCPFNITGHPALSMPVGWGNVSRGIEEGKLPIGMQLIGKRFDERTMLRAAGAWEVGGKWKGW